MDAQPSPQHASYPADVQALLDRLAASEREVAALPRDLSPGQLLWRPDDRAWSIAQCVDHLATANRAYLVGLKPAVDKARRKGWSRREPIAPDFLERLFIRSLEPPSGLRMRAPKKIIPALDKEPAAVWSEFASGQAESIAILREAADLDLNRARFTNPFISLVKVRAGSGFLILDAHERRHLWQIGNIRRKPGFPAA